MARGTDAVLSAPLIDEGLLSAEIALETQAIDDGVAKYRRLAREAVNRGDAASLKPAERFLVHWFEPLAHTIREEQKAARAGKPGLGRVIAGPVIRELKPEALAVITINRALGQCLLDPRDVTVVKLANTIGAAVIAEIHLRVMRNDQREAYNELHRRFREPTPRRVNWWAKRELDDPVVSRKATTHTGALLIRLLVDSASALDYMEDVFEPAFLHEKIRRDNKWVGILRLSETVRREIEKGHVARQFLRPQYLPMVVRPYRWGTDAQGGYIKIRTPLIAKPRREQKALLHGADLSRVYDGLDALAGTAWRKNATVHDTLRFVLSNGGNVAGLPPRGNLEKPPAPAGYDRSRPMKKRWEGVDPDVKKAYKREAARVIATNIRRESARASIEMALGVYRLIDEFDSFYFPHQLDSRGRTYPIPQHINHHGDDLCRGLLEFAQPVQLGERGFYWLCVHAANCFGKDKLAFTDRAQWALDHMREIESVARDPRADDWWMTAESPWQFLAACVALVDPDAGMRLPVQGDGTCNGLQHYAALSRSEADASLVNMMPNDRPEDIYSVVRDRVVKLVTADAVSGHETARVVLPAIDRATVKQPVMTTVYGVTDVGARKQIAGVIRESTGLQGHDLYAASRYLVVKVREALGSLCGGATSIMDWLFECAVRITEAGKPVAWESPIGLPVIQTYRKAGRHDVRTILQTIQIVTEDEEAPIKTRKQRTAFAPNFVHSIDGSHLLMTASAARGAGLDFAAVHDSYWTHAGDADKLWRLIREQFVELHRRPLLADLVRQFREQHPDIEFNDPPPTGTYNLETVLDCPYFFS